MATRAQKVSAAKKACQKRAKHRAAQNKYVAKNKTAQRKRVQASQKKAGPKKRTAGTGKHGSKIGRPQKQCNLSTPEYETIDLTGDGHGHHVPGTPYVYKHGWKPITSAAPSKHMTPRITFGESTPGKVKGKGKKRHTPKFHLVEGQGTGRMEAMGREDPATHRHLLNLANSTRTEIFRANGLTLNHPEVPEHELLERIKTEKDPKIRKEMIEDARRRTEVLELTLQAVERAEIDSKREGVRDHMARFDERLRQIKGGKAIIAMREKMLSDKTLDRLGFLKVKGAKVSKDVAIRVATATALGLVFGPLGAAAGIAGGAALQEVIHSLVEQSVVHAAIEHLMEKHVVDHAFDAAARAAKYGTKVARDTRSAKRAAAAKAFQELQAAERPV